MNRGPADHINIIIIRIPETAVSGIPLVSDLRTRMQDPDFNVVLGPLMTTGHSCGSRPVALIPSKVDPMVP